MLCSIYYGDDFKTGGLTFINVELTSLFYSGTGGGGSPFFNWEDCWGYINGEDKTAPGVTCPANTSQGTVIETASRKAGRWKTATWRWSR